MDNYTVWVGGTEVNDFLLSKDRAINLAREYIDDYYDDVVIEKIENGQAIEEIRFVEGEPVVVAK